MARCRLLLPMAACLAVLAGCQSPAMFRKVDSLAKIGRYHGPLLQSHGTADRLIPFAMGRQLFEVANEPKQFVAIPGGDHNDPQPDAYYVALSEFVGRL